MIRFACPHCRSMNEAPAESSGRMFTCSQCARQIVVPGAPVARLVPDVTIPSQPSAPSSYRPIRELLGGCGVVISLMAIFFGALGSLAVYGHDPRGDAREMNDRIVHAIVAVGWLIAGMLLLGPATRWFRSRRQ